MGDNDTPLPSTLQPFEIQEAPPVSRQSLVNSQDQITDAHSSEHPLAPSRTSQTADVPYLLDVAPHHASPTHYRHLLSLADTDEAHALQLCETYGNLQHLATDVSAPLEPSTLPIGLGALAPAQSTALYTFYTPTPGIGDLAFDSSFDLSPGNLDGSRSQPDHRATLHQETPHTHRSQTKSLAQKVKEHVLSGFKATNPQLHTARSHPYDRIALTETTPQEEQAASRSRVSRGGMFFKTLPPLYSLLTRRAPVEPAMELSSMAPTVPPVSTLSCEAPHGDSPRSEHPPFDTSGQPVSTFTCSSNFRSTPALGAESAPPAVLISTNGASNAEPAPTLWTRLRNTAESAVSFVRAGQVPRASRRAGWFPISSAPHSSSEAAASTVLQPEPSQLQPHTSAFLQPTSQHESELPAQPVPYSSHAALTAPAPSSNPTEGGTVSETASDEQFYSPFARWVDSCALRARAATVSLRGMGANIGSRMREVAVRMQSRTVTLWNQNMRRATSTPETAPNPADDPTYQQLIWCGGFIFGPVLFVLGAFLLFFTPREFRKTRFWGFLNLIFATLSVSALLFYNYNEPVFNAVERVETFLPDDHHSITPWETMQKQRPGDIGLLSPRGRWESAPVMFWNFSNPDSLAGWSAAFDVKEGRSLYGRVRDPVDREALKTLNLPSWRLGHLNDLLLSDGTVVKPLPYREAVNGIQGAFTEAGSAVSFRGVYWSAPFLLSGNIAMYVVFGPGAAPYEDEKHVSSKTPPPHVYFIENDARWGASPTHHPKGQPLAYETLHRAAVNTVPNDFVGAATVCSSPESGKVVFPSAELITSRPTYWSFLWRPTTGSQSLTVHQLLTLTSSPPPAKTTMFFDHSHMLQTHATIQKETGQFNATPTTEHPSISITSATRRVRQLMDIRNNAASNAPPEQSEGGRHVLGLTPSRKIWGCRFALIDTTSPDNSSTGSHGPASENLHVSIDSVFFRSLP